MARWSMPSITCPWLSNITDVDWAPSTSVSSCTQCASHTTGQHPWRSDSDHVKRGIIIGVQPWVAPGSASGVWDVARRQHQATAGWLGSDLTRGSLCDDDDTVPRTADLTLLSRWENPLVAEDGSHWRP